MNKKAKIASIISITFVALLLVFFVMAAKKECNNGIDDDGDGDIDLADAGCNNKGDNDESNCGDGVCEGGETYLTCAADCPAPECDDGTDNDGDGHTDLSDSECTGTSDNDESPRDFCNDSDGFNQFVQGTVSGEDDSSSFSNTDSCVNSTVVREHYCTGSGNDYDPTFTDWNCQVNGTGSCSSGACV